MQSRRVTRDSMGVRCTFLNIMRMFGRIQHFSSWGWAVGCLVVQGEAGFTALAPRFRWLLGTTDTHARRERRASLRRRDHGLLSSNHVSLCPAKTRMRENGGQEEEGNCTVTVGSRPGSRGAYLCCSFFSCFAVHDVITCDTT
jgi:hypothetical protein